MSVYNINKEECEKDYSSYQHCVPPGHTYYDTINIPDSITSIKDHTFSNCSRLKVTIPDSITFIDYVTFENCKSLQK